MRGLGLLFGFKFGIMAIVLISFFPMGVAYGAATPPAEMEYLDASEMYMTVEDLNDRENQPWHVRLAEDHLPEFLTAETELDPIVQGAVVAYANTIFDVGVSIFNSGMAFGHANRGWVSPWWAAKAGMGVIILGLLGFALSMAGAARRQIA